MKESSREAWKLEKNPGYFRDTWGILQDNINKTFKHSLEKIQKIMLWVWGNEEIILGRIERNVLRN